MKRFARKVAKTQSIVEARHKFEGLEPDKISEAERSIRAAGLSDTGLVRTRNEDALLVDTEMRLFVVADGLGGHSDGHVAARMVVDTLPGILRKRLKPSDHAESRGVRDVKSALRESVTALNHDLRVAKKKSLTAWNMGATVVVAYIEGAPAHIAHMGDSRAYLLRRGELHQLTDDHSIVAMLLRHGEISAQEAENHPARNSLTRFVGIDTEVGPDVRTIDLQPGDRLLLCSDGVWGMIEEKDLVKILMRRATPEETCRHLIEAGKKAGGMDNLTAVVVDVGEEV